MEWILTRIANAKGVVEIEGISVQLSPEGEKSVPYRAALTSGTNLMFRSEVGKLGDSEDSFLFFCTEIQPDEENFVISATFTVTDADHFPGWQSGFGIFAADTLASSRSACGFRNLLSVGRHRALIYDEYGCGVRVVSGHTDPAAEQCGDSRHLDASRVFQGIKPRKTLRTGESVRLTLRKTDRGFTASVQADGKTKNIRFPGCDFLQVQDAGKFYVGFGVAGRLSVQVSEPAFERSPGKGSRTPPDAIQLRFPDYPFSRGQLKGTRPLLLRHRRSGTLYASPNGSPYGKGTPERPFDLQTALWLAQRSSEIILLPGVYLPLDTVLVPELPSGQPDHEASLRALAPGAAVLDGSRLKNRVPVMLLQGSGWRMENLLFRRSPSVGLMISGSGNTIERCTACENGDTGILICSYPGSRKEEWPSDNLVSNCDSFRNADPAKCNADGFGAKLSVGEGNRFSQCIAHHNIDDGFDLYSKRVIGPIGAVELSECIAYKNGRKNAPIPAGSGFKLGGESMPVRHTVRNCLAYANCFTGFNANTNPTLDLRHLVSWGNGENRWQDNYKLNSLREDAEPVLEDLQPGKPCAESCPDAENVFLTQFVHGDMGIEPTRLDDGRIDRHGLFEPKPECL